MHLSSPLIDVISNPTFYLDLQLNGILIIDCYDNYFYTCDDTWFYYDLSPGKAGRLVKKIDLSGLGLYCNKPFKEVELHLTLERTWGFLACFVRLDKFTLDVSDLVTKKMDEPHTVLLKVDHSYQVGKADAVTIYDSNKNKLKHFPPTHDEGSYFWRD